MTLKNKQKKENWMNERMKKGYSFKYIKGIVNGEKINIAVECIDDGDVFMFEWEG